MPWLVPCKNSYVKFSCGKGGLSAQRRCSIKNTSCPSEIGINRKCYEMDTKSKEYIEGYPNVCYPREIKR